MEKFLGYEVFLVTKKCCFYAAFLITQMAESGKHLGDRPCHVLSGRRCDYFENAVLPGERGKTALADYRRSYMSPTAANAPEAAVEEKGEVIITPEMGSVLRAVRKRCLDCMETIPEVQRCPFNGANDKLCALWSYRFGHNPRANAGRAGFARNARRTGEREPPRPRQRIVRPLSAWKAQKATLAAKAHPHGPRAAVREYCNWCCADHPLEVRYCPAVDCPLHPHRFGHRVKAEKIE